jgi:type IV pilus assembly protein PilM
MRGPSVMVKSIQVPVMTALELEEHLGWEMDQYIPSDASDIYWDYHIVDPVRRETTEAIMSVLLVAVKKEAVHKRVELIQRSGLNPIVIDVDPLALSNMYAFNYEDGDFSRILLIQVSPSGVGMNVMNKGIPVFMREMEVGGERFRDLMEQTVGNPLEEKLTVHATPSPDFSEILLKEVYGEVSREVKKTIEYCSDMVPPQQIQKLFLGGGYARIPGLATTIEAEVDLPLEFIHPFKKLGVHSSLKGGELIQSFDLLGGVAIGLALRGINTG